MFDVFYQGPKPGLFVFEQPANNLEEAAEKSKTEFFWFIHGSANYDNFDFDWRCPPWENEYTHIFPSQWQRNGDVYFAHKNHVNKKSYKFQEHQKITRLADLSKWTVPENIDGDKFNYSWHPDPLEAEYEYHFPTQWQVAGGPIYKGTAGVKLVADQVATALPTKDNWVTPSNINSDAFDYSWHPNPLEPDYEYHFPTQWQVAGGPVYKGTHGTKLVASQIAEAMPDKSNWRIPDNVNDAGFDYSWHPNPLEPDYEYHFPTQWQKDGGPVYKGSAGIKYTTAQKIRVNATQIFYMDFMNPGSKEQYEKLKQSWPEIKLTRYVDSHLNVFKRIMNMADTEYVWIISSICQYDNFDFTWHPDVSQRHMIHCFSNVLSDEDRGDTFYINVPSFKSQMVELDMLDWFNVINYIKTQDVIRLPSPVVYYDSDNLVEEIKKYEFKTPYAVFTNNNNISQYRVNTCLWTKKDRLVTSLSLCNATATIPRNIKEDLDAQIYDYPYIDDEKVRNYYMEQPCDIIYISNGEPDEERWFKHLRESIIYTGRNKETANLNRLKWIRNVNGRVAAYQAAARASATPWFIAIFAKLEVGNSELWEWTPDYFQEPKHYIFNSKNVLNGLEYGHQGAIAYNKKLVLENNNPGIDFTLSQPHASVPILSGFAHFNQNPWMTWRTAFREVLKLKHFQETSPTVETAYRLKKWLTVAEGEHAEWCLRGASDAIEYYESVNGDYSKLMLSFEWAWLKEYYDSKY